MVVVFKSRAKSALLAACMFAVAGASQAASLMPNVSALNPAFDLTRQGDFDGDGRVDALYLITEDTGRTAVHIRLNTASGTQDIRVTSLDLPAGATPDIQVVKAGDYRADCGNFSSDCQQASITARHDSVILGLDGGVSVLAHWQGDHFEQDFVRSDEALMAHAVAALYAVR